MPHLVHEIVNNTSQVAFYAASMVRRSQESCPDAALRRLVKRAGLESKSESEV